MSDHIVKLVGQFRNLVGQCPMTDCYFQHCRIGNTFKPEVLAEVCVETNENRSFSVMIIRVVNVKVELR